NRARSGLREGRCMLCTLLHHRVIEAVVVTWLIVPDALGVRPVSWQEMPRAGAQKGRAVVCKKRRDLLLAFGAEHRAGAVHQRTARLRQRPQGSEQTLLLHA